MDNLTVQYSRVAELAKALGRPLTFFDLETTTFRGKRNFGITEVCGFSVTLDGVGSIYGHLINPEQAIDAKVVELTGITPAMVRDKETWGHRYAGLFRDIAHSHWISGFNTKTFDCPAVLDMNARYGQPIEGGFPYVLDVYRLYLALERPESKKGKLVDVADFYGVAPQGAVHRATADVILTVETLDAMLARHGVAAVQLVLEPQPSAVEANTAPANAFERIEAVLAQGDIRDVVRLAEALALPPKVAALELSKAVDEGRVNPMPFVNEATLMWLREMLVEAPTDMLLAGRLKPLYEHLMPLRPDGLEFDYLQLRIGLLDAQLPWASQKAPPPR